MMSRMFLLFQEIVPQHLLSRIVGWCANLEVPFIVNPVIRLFVAAYNVDMTEAGRENVSDYSSFNDFFTRELKAGARPLGSGIVSPADGRVSACGPINDARVIQAKGMTYSLKKLLAHHDVDDYHNGSFITIYLAPNNYHQVHIPLDSQLHTARYVPGDLYSVNDTTAQNVNDLFARNERLVCDMTTAKGKMALVMVGAMIVAGIRTVWRDAKYPVQQFTTESPNESFNAGDTLGHFELGSTVVLVFADHIDWKVTPGDVVQMGQTLAD